MTSGDFTSFPISDITVVREQRQRKELRNIDELAASIAKLGLIHPIIISRSGELIAGERRFTACKQLGWSHIPVQFVDELPEEDITLLELEENVKREDLTWQEHVLAVHRYHRCLTAKNAGWQLQDTAEELGISRISVGRMISVAEAVLNGDEAVANADKLSIAYGLVERKKARKAESAETELLDDLIPATATITSLAEEVESTAAISSSIQFIYADFIEWAKAYSGPAFNLLHCDFPYGIGADKRKQGTDTQIKPTYDDREEVYWLLLDALEQFMADGHVASSAHMIFWFSMNMYERTVERLRRMGWIVQTFPLIWHKTDNVGLLPDPKRTPRRTYETALLCVRGDRLLVRAKAASWAGPTERASRIHISQKPLGVLRHFMAMVCDDTSVVLDPTAGSGTALKVAEELGAKRVVGLEKDKEIYETTRREMENAED